MNKVLIVDDLEQNVCLLQAQLSGSGFESMCARNGAEALELARRSPPNVVISDLLMPTMDGFALLREWKKDSRLQNIPIIIYTSTYTDHKDEQLALSLGADCFLIKPVAKEVIISSLLEAIERRKAGNTFSPAPLVDDEKDYYRLYNETLVQKLEQKMLSLEKANQALDQSIIDLKQAEKKLRLRNDELIHFNYTVSHDLQTPLVTIKNYLGYLEKDMAEADSQRVKKDLSYIHTAVDKMNALLESLRAFSRIGRVANPAVEAPLLDIVQEALDLVAGLLTERGVKVAVPQKSLLLFGDRVLLVELFQNLIGNAVKFMGDQSDPVIEIGPEIKNNETVFFVRDNGMGIDPRHKDKLFGLFEKLHPEMEGTGMGLALVKRIIEIHGGRIWAESEGLGKGACFWFTLPQKSAES